ncbi:MAG: response regulator transcription factor [Sphingobacteriaceae bacterium]|nr:response regulator transcription factor [Sphingobacteriaceae bacterium]
MKVKVLLAEDEKNFGTVMRDYLNMNGYDTTWCENGALALSMFKEQNFKICILDVMMPEMDGFTLGREIKSIAPNTPIIYLTARTFKEDIKKGYHLGADDYLTKPFDSELLLLKLNAILKRNTLSTETLPTFFEIGKFTFDSKLRLLKNSEQETRLSPKENDLLKLLCEHKNNLLPREKALLQIWKSDTYFTSRSMDVYLVKLRKHLMEDTSVELVNLHGNGFSLLVKKK